MQWPNIDSHFGRSQLTPAEYKRQANRQFHGCFGPTANPMLFNGFAEVHIGPKTFIGRGECRYVKSDFPERGINAGHCFLDLSAPDDQYVGGLLTTNSITSRKTVGLDTDPPGYTQASIACIPADLCRAQRPRVRIQEQNEQCRFLPLGSLTQPAAVSGGSARRPLPQSRAEWLRATTCNSLCSPLHDHPFELAALGLAVVGCLLLFDFTLIKVVSRVSWIRGEPMGTP
jgi:hypothetical protein